MDKSTIAIIGAGNMGVSLMAGLIANQFPAKQIWLTGPDAEKLALLQKKFAVNTTTDNEKAVRLADVVVLAVKPKIIADVTKKIAAIVQQKKSLIISVATGIRIENLQRWLGDNIAIIRCMPNTPALIRAGVTGIYANPFVNTKQHALTESILRAVGMITWLENENDLDVITALSGCGPAYVFLIIEALQAAGEKLGLSAETARLLTLQTVLGATRMALESEKSPAELRHQVTPPDGATEAAIKIFEERKIRDIFTDAVKAAFMRAKEINNMFGDEEK